MAYKSWVNSEDLSLTLHSCTCHVDTALADGEYELVPAAEEVAAGGEVHAINVEAAAEITVEPEPEGKHRSIT